MKFGKGYPWQTGNVKAVFPWTSRKHSMVVSILLHIIQIVLIKCGEGRIILCPGAGERFVISMEDGVGRIQQIKIVQLIVLIEGHAKFLMLINTAG